MLDIFLGIPFNIASYALLTHILAAECDLDVGDLVISVGDAHIYLNHLDQVNEQLSRSPDKLPKLKFTRKEIFEYTVSDFELLDYNPQSTIKAEMAV